MRPSERKEMIALLVAMEKEATLLREESELLFKKDYMGSSFEVRKKCGTAYILAITGIGKSLSAAAVSALPFLYDSVDAFLNVGVSASLDPKALPPFSFFIPEGFVNHDIDTTAFGDPLGTFFRPNKVVFEADQDVRSDLLKTLPNAKKKGNEVSGDLFLSDPDHVAFLREKFDALGGDMETASEAAIAANIGLPFAALRIVSDGASKEEYEANFEKARALLTDAIWRVLGTRKRRKRAQELIDA